jgi:hypothetical protein
VPAERRPYVCVERTEVNDRYGSTPGSIG